MRSLALSMVLGLAACAGSSDRGAPEASGLDPALDACARGDLEWALGLLRDRTDSDSLRVRARILMMMNQNREAIELLRPLDPRRARKAKTYEEMERQQQVLPDLALGYVRQDDFLNAAQICAMMGESITAKKYESLSRSVAYLSNLGEGAVSVDFQVTDPVPVVAGTVNGLHALFAVDTMFDEVLIYRTLAKRAGLQAVGLEGGGSFDEATASQIEIGDLAIRNVPVHLGDPIQLGRLQVDGVIGLQLLMHYDFTLDYRRSRLVFRKAGGTIQGSPAYRLGNRYLLVGGTMNGKDRVFVAVGTALKGTTVAASERFVESQAGEIRELTAGTLKLVKPAIDLKAFPAGLDGSFGIPVGFVLGHSALRSRVVRVEPRSMRIAIE